MIHIIENKENIEVAVPFELVSNEATLWGQLAKKLLIIGCPSVMGVTENSTPVKVVRINELEDEVFRLLMGEGLQATDGFSLSWLKAQNEPWVKILKTDLNPNFDNIQKLEEEEFYFIQMKTLDENQYRASLPQMDELLAWVTAYGDSDNNLDNIFSHPATIAAEKLNFPIDAEL